MIADTRILVVSWMGRRHLDAARQRRSRVGVVRARTTYLVALILTCAAVWASPIARAATPGPRIALTVRVYQKAGVPTAVEKRALAEAEALLAAGLVDVRWQECTSLDSSPTCDGPPGSSKVLLIMREGAPCRDARARLGEALVVRRAGGVLATVYVNCVARLATAAKIDVAVLLGRVAAHELGHLVMRTSAHARRGLMRRNWTPDEIRRNRAADWAFTASDVAAMRQPGTEYEECGADLRRQDSKNFAAADRGDEHSDGGCDVAMRSTDLSKPAPRTGLPGRRATAR